MIVAVAMIVATLLGTLWYRSLERNVRDREIRRAHYVESFEAVAGLGDSPFRAARRLSNDPASLTVMAVAIRSFKNRIANVTTWMEDDNPAMAELYRRVVDSIEAEVVPLFAAALEPSELMGPARTNADPRFIPSRHLRAVVRAWTSATRYASLPGPWFEVASKIPPLAPNRLRRLLR